METRHSYYERFAWDGVHGDEYSRLHKLISLTSALPKYLMKRFVRGAGVRVFSVGDVTMWHHAEGKWARAEICRKKKKIYQLYPWASLTKMSLGGEDYGLIYNNWRRRRERKKNSLPSPECSSSTRNSVSSSNVPTNIPKWYRLDLYQCRRINHHFPDTSPSPQFIK